MSCMRFVNLVNSKWHAANSKISIQNDSGSGQSNSTNGGNDLRTIFVWYYGTVRVVDK